MDVQQGVRQLGPAFEHIAADGQLALERLQLPAGASVLDAGTGAGNFAIFLAINGFDVLTGEPETDTTHYARKDWSAHAAAVGVVDRIHFQPFNASQMPFEDGRFAAVFFFGVLHHVEDHDRPAAFREALRVVQPGGSVVFFEPSQATLAQIHRRDPGHSPPANPSKYLGSARVEETMVHGRRMDLFLYRTSPS